MLSFELSFTEMGMKGGGDGQASVMLCTLWIINFHSQKSGTKGRGKNFNWLSCFLVCFVLIYVDLRLVLQTGNKLNRLMFTFNNCQDIVSVFFTAPQKKSEL